MGNAAETQAGPSFEVGEDPRVGQVVQDRYRIVRRLGEGGMGVVYEGEHLLIKRRVAIKLLHAQFASDPLVVKRFHNEAIAATSIGNPHIVDVTDMGRLADGTFFMVLEFLDGRDFDDLIDKEGPQSVGRVVHILTQTCGALQAAHDQGIVHRDLKPENLYLIHQGDDPFFVKVLDFGIAKFMEQLDESMTQTGQTIGTPHFMSPEQLQGAKHLDARADIYALGVILYHALTGRFPFEAESFPLLIMNIFNHPPTPITTYRQDLPPQLVGVIEQCLAKNAAHRFASAAALKQALLPFREVASAPQMVAGAAHVSGGPTPPTLAAGATGPLVGPRGAPPPPAAYADTGQQQAHGSQPHGSQPHGSQPHGSQPHGSQPHGSQPHGSQPYGSQPYGSDPALAAGSHPGVPSGSHPAMHAGTPGAFAAPAPSNSKLPLFVALGSLFVALSVVAAFVVAGMNAPERTEARDATATEPTEAPGDQMVHVRIATEPPGAPLFLDGDPIPNPFDGDLPQSRETRRLEARLAGFQTHTQMLSLRFDQRITLTLEAEPTVTPTPPVEAQPVAEPVAEPSRPSGGRRGRVGPVLAGGPVDSPVRATPPTASPSPTPTPTPTPEPTPTGTQTPLKRVRF